MRINGLALRTQNINTWLLDKLLIYLEMHGISGAGDDLSDYYATMADEDELSEMTGGEKEKLLVQEWKNKSKWIVDTDLPVSYTHLDVYKRQHRKSDSRK